MPPEIVIIKPARGWMRINFRQLWSYRELLYFLVWRDIKVRYKQTALGAAWAVLQPVLTMLVFSVFFGRLAKVPSDGVPYPIFAYAGLLPWQLFSYALTESSNSLVGGHNHNLITKVYFPRLVIPASSVLCGVVDFAISFGVFLLLMLYYRIAPTWAILLLPLFVLMELATALSVGLWLSALNVQFRDVRYTIPFLAQFWLYASPVAYPSSLVPARWRPLLGLNPMAGVVDGFRWALLGNTAAPGPLLWVSLAAVLLLLVGGLMYFSRMESTFADIA